MALPKKLTIAELSQIVGVTDKQIYKLKADGVFSPNEKGEYDVSALRALFDHYRKGDNSLREEQEFQKLEKLKAEKDILQTKAKRLKRKLVDFNLVKADFETVGLALRDRFLSLPDKLGRLTVACSTPDEAREVIRKEIVSVLTALSELRPERYDPTTEEEEESVNVEEGDPVDG